MKNFIVESTLPVASISRLSKIATLIVIVYTVFNIAYLAYMLILCFLYKEPDLASFPHPNQFIGLERISFTQYPFLDVIIPTFADVIAQVDCS